MIYQQIPQDKPSQYS